MWNQRVSAVVIALGVFAGSSEASAFTIETAVSEGCHERITSEALRRVRLALEAAAPIEPSDDEAALIDDLHFSPDEDMRDLGGATLLMGVRDNDLKGHGSDDLTALPQVHGDPELQHEHCLRSGEQDEPIGSLASLAACRSFIEERVSRALDALDAHGRPDPGARVALRVHLAVRGDIDAMLPAYYVRIGQALHALEDGFSHTYRTADGKRVVVALNWLEVVDDTLLESRDGPPHSSALDACDDADDFRRLRRELATDAASELLRATLGPGTRDEKLIAVRALLDEYLGFEPGCSADNGWCGAPEASYDQGCSCAVTSTKGASHAAALVVLGLGLLVSRRAWAGRAFLGCLVALCLSFVWASSAQAQPMAIVVPNGDSSVIEEPLSERVAREPAAEPGPKDPNAVAWGGALTTGASIDEAGLALAAGARVRVHRNWAFGADVEWNPSLSITGGNPIRAGMLNAYLTTFVRFPLPHDDFNLRSSVSIGSSTLLMDLYGAPQGSTGVFLGASLLGVEYKASRDYYLVVNPLCFALPVPQLSGVPFIYPQYRVAVSFEFYGP